VKGIHATIQTTRKAASAAQMTKSATIGSGHSRGASSVHIQNALKAVRARYSRHRRPSDVAVAAPRKSTAGTTARTTK
jgi:hypothetical protein